MMTKPTNMFGDRFALLLNELRDNAVNLISYGPVILALLTLRYSEIINSKNPISGDVGTPLEETINILRVLWPYEKKLLSKFLEDTSLEGALGSEHKYPREFIATLQALNLFIQENGTDQLEVIFGDAFEFLLFSLSEMDEKTGGEAYTPRSIVNLMTEIVNPQSGEAVYDPTCGSGGFLLSAWKYVQKHEGGNSLDLYGQDINQATSCIARLNMIIHGIPGARITNGNALAANNVQRGKEFDIVMANPPFSVKSWRDGEVEEDTYRFGLPPKSNADFAFIQHVISRMKKMVEQ